MIYIQNLHGGRKHYYCKKCRKNFVCSDCFENKSDLSDYFDENNTRIA